MEEAVYCIIGFIVGFIFFIVGTMFKIKFMAVGGGIVAVLSIIGLVIIFVVESFRTGY